MRGMTALAAGAAALLLLSTGCASDPPAVPYGPAEWQRGWTAGCENARTYRAGPHYGEMPVEMAPAYRDGWIGGFQACKSESKLEQIGSPTLDVVVCIITPVACLLRARR